MIENIPLPRLLNSSNGTERRINPINVSVNLEITPLSYASITLPKDENLPARGYVELFTCMGSAGIYRVRSPQDAYGNGITTAELEHAVVEVGDFLVVEELDEMIDPQSAIRAVFRHYRGSKWTLGDTSALGMDHIALEAKYVRVLEAMLSILDQVPDCMMTFDFTTSPRWTINFAKRGTTVAAEGRLSRNVNYAKVTYDDTELCTRAFYEKPSTTSSSSSYYPTFNVNQNYSKNAYVNYGTKLYQLTSGHVAGVSWANTAKSEVTDTPTSEWTYIDADTIGTYGVIEREVQTGTNYTENEALYVAQEYLRTHKHPRISVEISLEELSSITGESFDTFTIGKLCRLALPDYNTTIEKNITALAFQNVYGSPRAITATLADEEDDVINFIHDVDSSGGSGGGGGGSRKQDDQWKEYRTIFEQDDYHFGLYAQRLNIDDEILQQAGLYIDANGVLTFAEDNENMLGSKLSVQAGRISAVATRMDTAEDILSQAGLEIDATTGVLIYHTDNANMWASKLNVQADRISLVVEGTGANAAIKPASIVAAINDAASSVKISADHIVLDGTTIANKLLGQEIVCNNVHTTTGTNLFEGHNSFPDTVSVSNSLTLYNDECDWKTYTAKYVHLSNAYYFEDYLGTQVYGRLVTGSETTTLHYLGKTSETN